MSMIFKTRSKDFKTAVRKNINLYEADDVWLNEVANKTRLTHSEIIRQLIASAREDWKFEQV